MHTFRWWWSAICTCCWSMIIFGLNLETTINRQIDQSFVWSFRFFFIWWTIKSMFDNQEKVFSFDWNYEDNRNNDVHDDEDGERIFLYGLYGQMD